MEVFMAGQVYQRYARGGRREHAYCKLGANGERDKDKQRS